MPDEIHGTDLFEIIRTTRSMRRLKPDPVPNELIRKILEAGVSAPSGGNMQRWRFLVIRDPKVKETVGALYKRAWDEQVAFALEFRRKLSSLPWQPAPRSDN
jgi:nitroreductase